LPNLFEDELTGRLDLSSEETAMFLYDLEPDDSLPYHYEYVEEWLLVVDGAVLVRAAESDVELARGALMRFAPGPGGAHQITNHGTSKARSTSSGATPSHARTSCSPPPPGVLLAQSPVSCNAPINGASPLGW